VANSRALHALADGNDRLWHLTSHSDVPVKVRFRRQTGKHFLVLSFTGFDAQQSSRAHRPPVTRGGRVKVLGRA
jgi:hypothetical protein